MARTALSSAEVLPAAGGPLQGRSVRPYWEQMLDAYYRYMGWDRKSGRPLPETLIGVGLKEVVDDIW